jgi:hypothetical protein
MNFLRRVDGEGEKFTWQNDKVYLNQMENSERLNHNSTDYKKG